MTTSLKWFHRCFLLLAVLLLSACEDDDRDSSRFRIVNELESPIVVTYQMIDPYRADLAKTSISIQPSSSFVSENFAYEKNRSTVTVESNGTTREYDVTLGQGVLTITPQNFAP